MKRSLLFLLMLPLWVKAQTSIYHPIPDSGAAWIVKYESVTGPSSYTSHMEEYYTTGDTVIGSDTCIKLYAKFTYPSSSTVNLAGVLRNDIPNKRVYFKSNPNYMLPFMYADTVLYDFSMNAGDSLLPQSAHPCYSEVSSTDSILINGQYRKQFHIPAVGIGIGEDVWIEGIGSRNFLFMPFNCEFEENWSLLCYKENGQNLYDYTMDPQPSLTYPIHPPQWDPCGAVNINAAGPVAADVKPNPFINELIITPGDLSSHYDAAITDVLGKDVAHYKIEGKTSINIDLPEGIYFLQLTDVNGNSSVKKIIRN